MNASSFPNPGRVAPIAISLLYAGFAAQRIAQDSFVVGGERFHNVLDDALISMRYGWNLAQGNGLVWNPGEYVEGYTNPLVVLLCAALSAVATKSAAVLLLQILGAAWTLAAAWLAAGVTRELLRSSPVRVRGARWAESLVMLATLFYYPLFILSLHGMETGLLTAILLLGVRTVLRGDALEDPRPAAALSAILSLAYLCRPDGAIPALVLLCYAALEGRRGTPGHRRLRMLLATFAPFATVIALHLLFRFAYYDAWVPNTWVLKIQGVPLADRVADGVAVGRLFLRESFLLLGLAGLGIALGRTRQHALLALLAASALAYHVYAGGDFLPDLWRFAVPGMPLLFVLAADAGLRGWQRLRPGSPAAWIPLALVALVFVHTSQRYAGRWIEDYEKRVSQSRIDVISARAIRWVTTPDATVGVIRAGYIPYYSERRGVDFLGKMDVHIARSAPHRDVVPAMARLGSRMWPGHAKYDLHYSVGERRPDVVQRMQWFEQDLGEWARDHYLRLALGRLSLYLKKGSTEIEWSKLACDDATCRLEPRGPTPEPTASIDASPGP